MMRNFHPLKSPLDSASYWSILSLSWMTPLITLGSQRPLESEDVYELPDQHRTHLVFELASVAWQRELKQAVEQNRKPSLQNALWHAFKRGYLWSFIAFLPYLVVTLLQPLFVSHILEYVATKQTMFLGISNGYGLAVLLGILSFIAIITFNNAFFQISRAGFYCRSAVVSMIFDKTLKLTCASKNQHTTGEIMTMVSVDAERVWLGTMFTNWLWAGPALVVIAMAMLAVQVNYAAIAGAGASVLLNYIQGKSGLMAGLSRRALVKCTDERTKLINESLQGIRVVKLYAWEEPIEKRIADIRSKEVAALAKYQLLRMINTCMMFIGPVLVAFAVFISYQATGGELTVPKVYTVYALLNIIRLPFALTPQAWTAAVEAHVSLQRITNYLLLEEIEDISLMPASSDQAGTVDDQEDVQVNSSSSAPSCLSVCEIEATATLSLPGIELTEIVTTVTEADMGKSLLQEDNTKVVYINNANFHWKSAAEVRDEAGANPDLESISFEAKAGEFIAIVGQVGSGKTSLLSAILGQMHRASGDQYLNGKIAYIGQEHWIQNSKLVDNITFGGKFHDERYTTVMDASQLSKDLLALPHADHTSIGERGINLSGGQKARVSVARALYCDDAEIYLIDDALAAVDVHVGKALFRDAITGLLKTKTRIVALSSNYHLLPFFDKVVVMVNGRIVGSGTYSEISQQFPQFCAMDVDNSSENSSPINNKDSTLETPKILSIFGANIEEIESKRASSAVLMSEEDRERGAVSKSTYIRYFEFVTGSGGCGKLLFALIILLFIVSQGIRILADIWVGEWAAAISPKSHSQSHSSAWYRNAYIIIVCITTFLVCLRSYAFIEICLEASRNVHNVLVVSILRAPINKYFDITPVGRILNRFSKDMDSMDSLLPDFFLQNLQNTTQVAGILAMCLSSTPYFVLLLVPLAILFVYVQSFFRKTSRELKRLDGVARSPVYSSFGEVLQGLVTIRAYGKTLAFKDKLFELFDTQTRNYFSFYMASRWLAVRLDFVGVCIIFAVVILAIGLSDAGGLVNPNLLGMALVYALQLTGLLQWAVRVAIETETNMTSVERLLAFTQIEAENYEGHKVPPRMRSSSWSPRQTTQLPSAPVDWPSKGAIEISHLHLRYREGLECVLKGVNLSVKGGSKVGVCGRTGAGKSSLMLALFRIVEPEDGSVITVDGEDILTMSLSQLRSSLTIIPQDPVMFSGTLRYNLDPFGVYSDEEVWEALARSHLKDDVLEKFPEKLNHPVSERGENISVGQRQLLCIARALLRKSRVIVMDEATASVDTQTDSKIQTTVRDEFKNCTVLTIAHRLETIADYDIVVVMDDGVVAESGPPALLIDKVDGLFKSLVDELGPERRQAFVDRATR